jgi:predicted glycosyltransferase
MKRVLYISGSVGLGHVTRDVVIARALRKVITDLQIEWLSEEPATSYLRSEGEVVLPEAAKMVHGNRITPDSEVYGLNVMRWFMSLRKEMASNAEVILQIALKGNYDLVIGDEAFDLTFEFWANPDKKTVPFAMIYDCYGADQVSHNPKDMFFTWYLNRLWDKFINSHGKVADRFLFIGELEDIEDKPLGMFLPNRRSSAKTGLDFVGHIIRFDPEQYADQQEIKKMLGYGDNPLILVTKGGTSVGKSILDLSVAAFPFAKEKVPDLNMVLFCGPSIDPGSIKVPEGVCVKGFEPRLYEHIAASDLVITQGGHTTLNEVMALEKPFIVFPLGQHFDQIQTVRQRCDIQGAGVKMNFSQTTPEMLGKEMVANVGKKVSYPSFKANNGEQAAAILRSILK